MENQKKSKKRLGALDIFIILAIAACVIGGVSFVGGTGKVSGISGNVDLNISYLGY